VGRHAAPAGYTRVTVNVSDRNVAFITRREDRFGRSITESVAHALSVLETVETAIEEGGEVVVKPRHERPYRLELSW
jgi:hypothetical protein